MKRKSALKNGSILISPLIAYGVWVGCVSAKNAYDLNNEYPNLHFASPQQDKTFHQTFGHFTDKLSNDFPDVILPPAYTFKLYDGQKTQRSVNADSEPDDNPYFGVANQEIRLDSRLMSDFTSSERKYVLGHEFGHVVINNNPELFRNYTLLTQDEITNDEIAQGVTDKKAKKLYLSELRADWASLYLTHDPKSLKSALNKMALSSAKYPDDKTYTHPSIALRIKAAERFAEQMQQQEKGRINQTQNKNSTPHR